MSDSVKNQEELVEELRVPRSSENHFRIVCENAPVALYEEDFSEVKAYIEKLRDKGVTDFETYFTNHRDAVFECAQLPKVVNLNKATFQLYDYRDKEDFLAGAKMHMSSVFGDGTPVGESSFNAFRRRLIAIAQGETISEAEVFTKTSRGARKHIIIRWTLVPGYEDTWSRVLVSHMDATQLRLMEASLRESENRYRELFDNAPISLWSEDWSGVKKCLGDLKNSGVDDFQDYFDQHPDVVQKCVDMMKVVDVNKATMALFGAANKEELFANINSVFGRGTSWGNESFDTLKRGLVHLAGEDTIFESELAIRTLGGDRKIIAQRWSVAPGFEETWSKVLVSMTDVTESKRVAAERNSFREKMLRAEHLASLGTMNATMTHELNQPLTVIRLLVQDALAELEKTSGSGIAVENLRDSLAEVSNALSIVQRFRNLTHQPMRSKVDDVDLYKVAKRIVPVFHEAARRAKVELVVRHMDKLPSIKGNLGELEQLFFILIQNALQAADGRKQRRVTVDGKVKDKHIELCFSDNCGGIAPENLTRVFEPFFTSKPVGEGTGLGLTIAERIVDSYGGTMRVASQLGRGTTFFVTLPIRS